MAPIRRHSSVCVTKVSIAVCHPVVTIGDQASCRGFSLTTSSIGETLDTTSNKPTVDREGLLSVVKHVQRTCVIPENERTLRSKGECLFFVKKRTLVLPLLVICKPKTCKQPVTVRFSFQCVSYQSTSPRPVFSFYGSLDRLAHYHRCTTMIRLIRITCGALVSCPHDTPLDRLPEAREALYLL